MKTIRFSIILSLFMIVLCYDIDAQKSPGVSIYYNYLKTDDDNGWKYYPTGLGAAFSLPLSKRLTFHSGIDYSYRHSSDNYGYGPSVQDIYLITREWYFTGIHEKFNESLYLLNIGMYYALINKKLSVQIGGNIVPTYCHETWSRNTITYSDTDTTRHHSYGAKDAFVIGFNIGVKIEYLMFKKILNIHGVRNSILFIRIFILVA